MKHFVYFYNDNKEKCLDTIYPHNMKKEASERKERIEKFYKFTAFIETK